MIVTMQSIYVEEDQCGRKGERKQARQWQQVSDAGACDSRTLRNGIGGGELTALCRMS